MGFAMAHYSIFVFVDYACQNTCFVCNIITGKMFKNILNFFRLMPQIICFLFSVIWVNVLCIYWFPLGHLCKLFFYHALFSWSIFWIDHSFSLNNTFFSPTFIKVSLFFSFILFNRTLFVFSNFLITFLSLLTSVMAFSHKWYSSSASKCSLASIANTLRTSSKCTLFMWIITFASLSRSSWHLLHFKSLPTNSNFCTPKVKYKTASLNLQHLSWFVVEPQIWSSSVFGWNHLSMIQKIYDPQQICQSRFWRIVRFWLLRAFNHAIVSLFVLIIILSAEATILCHCF